MKGSWLWLLSLVNRISLNLWWLYWIVACISFFDSVANVYVHILASLSDCDSTWPSQRFDNIGLVVDSSFSLGIFLIITTNFQEPRELKRNDRSILLKIPEPLRDWISLSQLRSVFLVALLILRDGVSSLSAFQDGRLTVGPSF